MPEARPRTILPGAWAMGAGIVLTSLILRPGATSTGPVLAEIRAATAMSATGAALLSALPGLSFALAGAVAARLGHRLGAVGALAVGCALGAVGLVARAFSSGATAFLALSMVALAGAGLGNVLVPMAVKQRFPLHSGAWTAVYVTVLPIGAVAPQLVAPALLGAGATWRDTVQVWGWVSALAALPWAAILAVRWVRRVRSRPAPTIVDDGELGAAQALALPSTDHEASGLTGTDAPQEVRLADIARSRRARALALFFGLQSMQAYVTFGWLPQIYRDAGLGLDRASLLVALFSVWGIPGGFVIPPLVTRSRHLQAWVMFFVALLGVGYGGLLLAPTTVPWLWPCALGVAGFCFQVALVLITSRTRDYRVTAALSGFTQSIGYALASVGPFLVGWVHGLTGSWSLPLVLLLASAVPMAWSGWHACAAGTVDDEIRTV